ncbi:L,D-transpeptidase family protein [Desulfoscipio geothermicus]|uniref:Putative peptidoglycan binding domain-containing protein n=1 Tax=Desulfoscipio geothermicus DSM 3669 TaxID=1121426 RepID=A0A1I6E4W8_9FIRM|nr:peptidoglycan-binding protein [Desulfoscipio geothermicus]SFR12800.1 Putative peptidoglycan binding domain-containing protein [Desulfoscipio geothermicus DSM 3669]
MPKHYIAIIIVLVFAGLLLCSSPARAVPGCPECRVATEGLRILKLQKPAMHGADVRLLQLMLKKLNFYRDQVNGVYGPRTVQAVQKFQQTWGAEPDGVVTEATWEQMEQVYSQFLISENEVPPPPGEVSILVDTYRRKLTVLSDGEPYKQYPVAVGKYKTPTPIGTFKVLRRARNWGTGFGTRWIGLTVPWGIYGIHGTNKPYAIGSYASHGCIRMNNKNVEEIYPWVKPGTRVIIIGNPFMYQPDRFRTMRRDERGGDVLEVQMRLQRLGYYDGPLDGIWGGGMERAVMEFRKSRKLSRDNAVDAEVYRALGL